jgi:hypothetical protein
MKKMVVFSEMQIFGLNVEDHHEEVNYQPEEQGTKEEQKKSKQGYVNSPNKHHCVYYIERRRTRRFNTCIIR